MLLITVEFILSSPNSANQYAPHFVGLSGLRVPKLVAEVDGIERLSTSLCVLQQFIVQEVALRKVFVKVLVVLIQISMEAQVSRSQLIGGWLS